MYRRFVGLSSGQLHTSPTFGAGANLHTDAASFDRVKHLVSLVNVSRRESHTRCQSPVSSSEWPVLCRAAASAHSILQVS